jgi:hypothetical protein
VIPDSIAMAEIVQATTQAPARSRDTERVDAPRPTVPLGQLLLQRGLLDEEQLEIALAEHMSSGKMLGEVLVAHGWLTQGQIAELLDEQRTAGAGEDQARGIYLLRTRVAEAEAELEQPAVTEAPEPEPAEPDPGHVLFVWSPSGYALLARAGEPPPVGSEVGVSGGRLVVVKIGPSPLPGDRRRCAYLDLP